MRNGPATALPAEDLVPGLPIALPGGDPVPEWKHVPPPSTC